MKNLKEYLNEAELETILHFSCIESAALFFCEYSGQISDGKYENAKPSNHYRWLLNIKGVVDGNEYYEGISHVKRYTFGEWDKYIKKGLAGNPDSTWGFTIRTYDIARFASALPKAEVLSIIEKDGHGFAYVAEKFGEAAREGKSWGDLDIELISKFAHNAKCLINQKNYEDYVRVHFDFKDFLMARVSCEESINTWERK